LKQVSILSGFASDELGTASLTCFSLRDQNEKNKSASEIVEIEFPIRSECRPKTEII
jgi:hypothetical protein